MATIDEKIDPVLHALGPLGLYACVQCFLFYLTYLTDAHIYFSYIFVAKDVAHKCASPSNGSVPDILEVNDGWLNSTVRYDQCHIYANSSSSVTSYPCLFGMEYDEPKDTSIVSEFDLVCGQGGLAELTQTLMSLGVGLGAIIWPWVSDLYGRKSVVVMAQVVALAVSLMATFAPNYATFAVAKFSSGFTMSGNGVIAVTAGVELFPSSHRIFFSGGVSSIWWVICIFTVSPMAYLLRFHSWRTLQLAFTIHSAGLAVLLFFCLKEPLRWLEANGKHKESERVLKTAAKWNKKDFQTVLNVFQGIKPILGNLASPAPTGSTHPPQAKESPPGEPQSEDLLQENEREETPAIGIMDQNDGEEKLSFLVLVQHPLLRRQALIIWFMWFVDHLVYSALFLMSDTLAVDLYLGFFLNAAMEGVSGVFIILMRRLGRRTMLGIFHSIAAIGLVTSSVCFYYKDIRSVYIIGTVSSLLGKAGISGAFSVLFLYTPEIFPTNIRNRALGTSFTMSTVGAMISPYSGLLVDYAVWAPGAVFGFCCVLVVALQLMLPESSGRELPQTLHDLERWYDVTSSDKLAKAKKQEKPVSEGIV